MEPTLPVRLSPVREVRLALLPDAAETTLPCNLRSRMPTQLVVLVTPIPDYLSSELAKRVYYVSPEIEQFHLVSEGGRVVAVEVTTSVAGDVGELSRKLDLIIAKDVLPQREVEAEVVWSSPHRPRNADGTFAQLAAAGMVAEMGEGIYATGALFHEVLSGLDRRLHDLAVGEFAASAFHYPNLISTDTLRRAGYMSSFPQFLMTASRFRSDVDTYDSFASGVASVDDIGQHIEEHSEHLGYCLPPAMCYHVYQHLQGRGLAEGPIVVTTRGQTFRFESRYRRSLERLWEFTMREVVFIGERTAVAEQRRRLMSAVGDMVTELGLAGQIEVANDPFFFNGQIAEYVRVQRAMELKYELCLPVEHGRSVAAGSFNIHGEKFGSAFGITLADGGAAHSACVGFGLERFAYALFCQHGVDLDAWPDDVRAMLRTSV
ncbi:hypothetical protein JNW91_07515 [Micromonospora sp. STR1_7]|uniref:Aminoacyl-transfer RNA synthetases class-II family profile domain-containing protein n=1 Tax=Micromonospora parastrephiae TaxID=2806101 RepID=A0ABS1XR44_9ACTN|nr:hypothetical protein [Micromonospora parastrephiae]MBM0231718.1 hypothetical protein [Micromonospora parastrephiae]